MDSKISEPQVIPTRSGQKFIVQVRHDGLHKFQEVRGDDIYVIRQKALGLAHQWNDMWEKRLASERRRTNQKDKQQQAEQRTTEAQLALESLTNILAQTLEVNDAIDWESLKKPTDYDINEPTKPNLVPAPIRNDPKYRVNEGCITSFFGGGFRKEREMQSLFESDLSNWQKSKEAMEASYYNSLQIWEKDRSRYLHESSVTNKAIEAQKQDYLKGNDPQAIMDYCDLVLSRSIYPDYFPQSFELEYNLNNKILVVNYMLPSLADIPALREVKYVQSRDEFTEKHISDVQKNKLYDDLLYQIALRTLHELFEADRIDAIDSIGFNGIVHALNPATGMSQDICVLTLQVSKVEFEQINLAKIDPKACFKSLKGISSSRLFSYVPVAPVLQMNKEDRRFVTSYDVAATIQEGDNLATMPWEDFEHLIREIFEKEFSVAGGEVKVTQASRDGGVDAVVFDPDPLRGGKIVIQAKRYNNTVGVSAVRDLYGTLMNEGANKGILVTTSDYGPDAYEFAKGKPLVLLNGSNLLHLLEKHGHKARISLHEARKNL